ncbi:type VI secretion protein, partial [Amycolatopsis sp. NPDC049252]
MINLHQGWIGSYLTDPWTALHQVTAAAIGWALSWGPVVVPVLAVLGAAQALGRRWWRHRCHAALVADARCVTVLAPPTVDPAGGALLWSNLVGLLRPSWRRWFAGQPHLVWEYRFSEHGVTLQLWVPGVIPPGLVERAIEAAWPGCHTRTVAAGPPLPEPGADRRPVTVGGQLRLARSEALPIRTGFDADPIRGLLGAPVGLGRDEYASVQVLTRPVTGRRVGQARRAARRVHAGTSGRLGGRILDLLTPGTSATRSGRP